MRKAIFVLAIALTLSGCISCSCQDEKKLYPGSISKTTYQKELEDVLNGKYGDSWRIEFKDGGELLGYWSSCYTLRVLDGTKLEYTQNNGEYKTIRKIEDITQISGYLEEDEHVP